MLQAALVEGRRFASGDRFDDGICKWQQETASLLKLLNLFESSIGLSGVLSPGGLTMALISLSKMRFSANSSFSGDRKNVSMSPG